MIHQPLNRAEAKRTARWMVFRDFGVAAIATFVVTFALCWAILH